MVWQRDVDLVVPLWQGGDDVRVAAGAGQLARLVPTHAGRLHIAVTDRPRHTRDHIRNLDTVAETTRRMRDRLTRRAPDRILTLGGDCTSDIAAAQHLAARHPDLALYWIDAHADLNVAAHSPSGLAHGMALRVLLGDGHPDLTGPAGPALAPDRVVLAGVRDLDPPERAYIAANNLTALSPHHLTARPENITAHHRPGTPAYIHLDLDVCDPRDMPAVSLPTDGGPAIDALTRTLAAIAAHHRIAGIAVTEYAPVVEHDENNLTALLTALGLIDRAPA